MTDSEERIQNQCYTWFHNTFPELRGLLNYNHNNPKNRIDGARQRSLGLQKGRSDMVFYYMDRAVMIEFKTLTGKQQEVQKVWEDRVRSQGFQYHVIRDLETFKALINDCLI